MLQQLRGCRAEIDFGDREGVSLSGHSTGQEDNMRRAVKVVVLSGLLVASLTAPVAGKDLMVGPVRVELVLPTNFCELNPIRSVDGAHIARHSAQFAQSGVQFLSVSAHCSELAAWRAGAGLLDHYIFFSTDAQFLNQPTPVDPEIMRQQICDQIRAQAAQSVSASIAEINSQSDAIARNIKMNGAAVVGIDDNDPNACYTAVLQKLQTQFGTEKLQLLIDTTVVIKGKIMFSTAFMPYVDMQGVAKSLAENRKFVASWRAANGMLGP
ncbi:MAG: hypothetical protein Q7U92_00305 [Bradyrhizobium sp.]|nr:hypothetical protein [Bradyrhizobium sp.]